MIGHIMVPELRQYSTNQILHQTILNHPKSILHTNQARLTTWPTITIHPTLISAPIPSPYPQGLQTRATGTKPGVKLSPLVLTPGNGVIKGGRIIWDLVGILLQSEKEFLTEMSKYCRDYTIIWIHSFLYKYVILNIIVCKWANLDVLLY